MGKSVAQILCGVGHRADRCSDGAKCAAREADWAPCRPHTMIGF
jgi:hypothetical protein